MTTSLAIEKPKVTTNWNAFKQAGLNIKTVRCDGYLPIHPYNNGCHTVLRPHYDCLEPHISGEHQGGFNLELDNSGTVAPLWDELAKAGVEIRDFRCAHCNHEVRLHGVKILEHFKQHPGSLAKSRPEGRFWITLTHEKPLELDEETL